jgi:hypothetical protein
MFSSPRKDDHPDNHAPQEAKHDAEHASKNDASPRTASNSGKAPESERRQDAPGSSSPLRPSPRQDSHGSDSASQSASQSDAEEAKTLGVVKDKDGRLLSPRGAENAKAKHEESKDSGSSLPGIHQHQNHNDEAAAFHRVSLIKAQVESEQAQKLANEAPPKMVTKASTVPTLMSTAVNHSPWGLPPKPAEGFHTYGYCKSTGKPIINNEHRETIDQHVEDYFHQSHSRRKNFKQSFNDRGYFHNLQGHWVTAQLRAGQAKEKAIGLWNSGTALVQEHIPYEALKGCTSKCHSGKETEDYDDKHGATHVY